MSRLGDWLDGRTGYRALAKHALYENIPGGSRWRYIWGSTLVFTLTIQFVTGIFLWFGYSASAQTAWESVYYLQQETSGGWLLRGLHHYTAQAMNVLLVLHLMQVVIDGAYQAPREVNFWMGIIMLQLVLALSLTGYLLPWDQKGYWATKVTTDLAGIVPVVGPQLQKLIIGGAEYGHHTLTRFFALHAGVLPGALVGLVVLHICLFRRHGITAREPKRRPDAAFWPDQVLKDGVACLAVLVAILFLTVRHRLSGDGPLGAELSAPADPSEPYSAARPEWYFLFLYQLLKYFPGRTEIIGALIIPGAVMGIIFLMPWLGRTPRGHRFNLVFLGGLLVGAAVLTVLALNEDRRNPIYRFAVADAQRAADRIRVLAQAPAGIPPTGAAGLLQHDPFIQGPRIFSRNCASCHRYAGHDGQGQIPGKLHVTIAGDTTETIARQYGMTPEEVRRRNRLPPDPLPAGTSVSVNEPIAAPDLDGFASRRWLAGLLDPEQIAAPHYLGATKFADGKMARYVKRDVARFTPEQRASLQKVISALSAEARLRAQAGADNRDAQAIAEGRRLIASEEMRCTECHSFGKVDEDATAPELTGYGSRAWLVDFIRNPAHSRFYGNRNDRMPAFGEKQILDEKSIGLVVDWLRGEWYEPKAGPP